MSPVALSSLRPVTAAATSPTNRLILSGITTPHSSNPSWAPARTRAYGFLLLAGHHDNLRGRPAVPALPSRRIGARRASQRLRPPRYHLNLRSQRCLGAQSFRRLGTPNRPSSAGAQGKKARRPKIGAPLASKALADVPRKNEALQAHAVIIATGGNPTGIADTFRLPLTSLRPILCPVSATVVGDRTALKTLDGLRVRARLTLARNHNELWHEDGEVLFRAFGISGVAVFNLSRRIQRGDTILLDVFPDLSKDKLLDMLNRRVELLGSFSPRDPRWLDGMLARNSPASSARRSSSAIQAPTMSSTWSRSSSTLSCSSREQPRSARRRSRVVAYLSRASQHPVYARAALSTPALRLRRSARHRRRLRRL